MTDNLPQKEDEYVDLELIYMERKLSRSFVDELSEQIYSKLMEASNDR